jgi:hypothetical protein
MYNSNAPDNHNRNSRNLHTRCNRTRKTADEEILTTEKIAINPSARIRTKVRVRKPALYLINPRFTVRGEDVEPTDEDKGKPRFVTAVSVSPFYLGDEVVVMEAKIFDAIMELLDEAGDDDSVERLFLRIYGGNTSDHI